MVMASQELHMLCWYTFWREHRSENQAKLSKNFREKREEWSDIYALEKINKLGNIFLTGREDLQRIWS